MLIPITSEDSASCPEWALIELQGEVQFNDNAVEQALQEVGTLAAKETGDALQLTIGYHQLEGKRVPLKKPYAILDKHRQEGSGSGDNSAAQTTTTYKVVGVVRSKLLFKTRPRALISKPK